MNHWSMQWHGPDINQRIPYDCIYLKFKRREAFGLEWRGYGSVRMSSLLMDGRVGNCLLIRGWLCVCTQRLNSFSCAQGLVYGTAYTIYLKRKETRTLYLVFCGLSQLLIAECILGLYLQQSSEESVGCHCQEFYFSIWMEAIQCRAFWRKHLFYVLVVAWIIQIRWGCKSWCQHQLIINLQPQK